MTRNERNRLRAAEITKRLRTAIEDKHALALGRMDHEAIRYHDAHLKLLAAHCDEWGDGDCIGCGLGNDGDSLHTIETCPTLLIIAEAYEIEAGEDNREILPGFPADRTMSHYTRSDLIAELSGLTDLPHEAIERVLDELAELAVLGPDAELNRAELEYALARVLGKEVESLTAVERSAR